MSLPLAELERRCRHNGLSLVGGREMMVARLLSLEEAEKQRGYELDDELKYPPNQPSSGKYSSSQRETSAEPEPMGLSGLNQYGDEDMQGKGFTPLAPTLPIPQPELKAFTKKEKNDLVLPASKWAREDDESDDEQGKGKNLGLSYSSSGSENVGDGLIKADESEAAADSSFPAHADSGMNEEQRLHYISFLDCHPFCSR
jgi:U2-associated protein SR140